MYYLLKLFPEITIKSRSVRRHMTRCLTANVRNTLRPLDERIRVQERWDSLQVASPDDLPDATRAELQQRLTRIPGIHEVQVVEEVGFHDLDEIADRLTPLWQAEIAGRRFRVSARRRGQHDFSSADMERHLGARLLAAAPGASVDLAARSANQR